MNLKFVKTCPACPEQYDVFNKEGKIVAYIRLRWGTITIQCPDSVGVVILNENYGYEMCGEFMRDKDRKAFIKRAENS